MQTFVVVVETKKDGKLVEASELKTVVAESVKAAEQQAIAELAKTEKFEAGMEATAVPFSILVKAAAQR